MTPENDQPGGLRQTPPTPEIAKEAVRLLAAAASFCHETGIRSSIGIFDLPREAFDAIADYESASLPGSVIASDPENLMWWKRAPGQIHVYTREPPIDNGGRSGHSSRSQEKV